MDKENITVIENADPASSKRKSDDSQQYSNETHQMAEEGQISKKSVAAGNSSDVIKDSHYGTTSSGAALNSNMVFQAQENSSQNIPIQGQSSNEQVSDRPSRKGGARPKLPEPQNVNDLREQVRADILQEEAQHQREVEREKKEMDREAIQESRGNSKRPSKPDSKQNQNREACPFMTKDEGPQQDSTEEHLHSVIIPEGNVQLPQGLDQMVQESTPEQVNRIRNPHIQDEEQQQQLENEYYEEEQVDPTSQMDIEEDLEIFKIIFEMFDQEKQGYVTKEQLLYMAKVGFGIEPFQVNDFLHRIQEREKTRLGGMQDSIGSQDKNAMESSPNQASRTEGETQMNQSMTKEESADKEGGGAESLGYQSSIFQSKHGMISFGEFVTLMWEIESERKKMNVMLTAKGLMNMY